MAAANILVHSWIPTTSRMPSRPVAQRRTRTIFFPPFLSPNSHPDDSTSAGLPGWAFRDGPYQHLVAHSIDNR